MRMGSATLPLIVVFVVKCLTLGNASKDSKSYGSYTNPNVVYDHYWSDASGILQDLGYFSKLYVQYHGCA